MDQIPRSPRHRAPTGATFFSRSTRGFARHSNGRGPARPVVSSRYADYVGRVGALAVILGVGAAIVSLPAVALADTTGSAGSTDSSNSSSGSDSSGSQSGSESPGSASSASIQVVPRMG